MKAITFQSKSRITVESVPDPELVSSGDVIVQTRLTAICGSDLHVYLEREKGIEPGTVMGHEFLGEIVEVGVNVRTLSVGDLVVSPFTTSCGGCFYCRRGLTCRCESGQLFGWVENGAGLEGAQSDYVRVPLADSTLVKLPDGVEEEPALFLGDILATGFYGAEMAGVLPDGIYAVLGCGPVGLLAILAARELGAERIFALDLQTERLELAQRFGAIPVEVSQVDPIGRLREATEGRGADGVLEAVGSPEATRLAIDLVRPGGVISALGVHTETRFAFSPAEAYDKNLTYRSGRCPARHYIERLLPLVQEKKYDLASIISHRLPLSEGVRGYEIFEKKLEACTKVVLRP